jgi:hypothetical protein
MNTISPSFISLKFAGKRKDNQVTSYGENITKVTAFVKNDNSCKPVENK